MRGTDEQQSDVFSCLSHEKRAPKDHPLRDIRTMVDQVLARLSRRFVRFCRTAVDSTGEVAAGAAAADSRHHPQGAFADGRDGLQLAVPLVCGPECR